MQARHEETVPCSDLTDKTSYQPLTLCYGVNHSSSTDPVRSTNSTGELAHSSNLLGQDPILVGNNAVFAPPSEALSSSVAELVEQTTAAALPGGNALGNGPVTEGDRPHLPVSNEQPITSSDVTEVGLSQHTGITLPALASGSGDGAQPGPQTENTGPASALVPPMAANVAPSPIDPRMTIAEIYRMIHAKFAPCGLFRINTPALPLIEGDPGWTSDHVPTLAELFTGSDWPLVDHVNRVCMMLTRTDRINRFAVSSTHMFRRTFCDSMNFAAPPDLVESINTTVFDFATEIYESCHDSFMDGTMTIFEVAIRANLLWSERLAPHDPALAKCSPTIRLVRRIVKFGPDRHAQCRLNIAASLGPHMEQVVRYVDSLPADFAAANKYRMSTAAFMWLYLLDEGLYGNKLLRACMPLDAMQMATTRPRV
ncbi:hypothetical protein J8273_6621 [Carpediemonas membranifera]|uniref:Uncharacterized protein n=1 Tax=Carpediemonas membranifera TaxID=201153 RepID=A0A8J6ATI8_9EUKA|nr:hypothetical protein J8273_6621 [Carpediemonas membranifera]|eukprot:KAG9392030.1 hypothetical protein J8273_6621 [Carpediemonas membranifera]